MGIDNNLIKVWDLEEYLNKFLNLELYRNKDDFRNGLVYKWNDFINWICFTTTLTISNLKIFLSKWFNAVISHHSVEWPYDFNNKRLDFIKKNKLTLFTYHYPLDIHKVIWNNISIFNIMSIEPKNIFFKEYWIVIDLKKEVSVDIIIKSFKRVWLFQNSFIFGEKNIKRLGIVSWWWDKDSIEYYSKYNVDLFITGEVREMYISNVMDSKKNYIVIDHYKSELLWLIKLSQVIKSVFPNVSVYVR
jgi:putative NIF3 family GTP cyclohydrolase 1 type 2